MLTMFGQSESQITEVMEVDSSTNLEEIDDNGEAIDFDNVDLDLDDDYEDQFNENVDETPMYTNKTFPPLDEPLSLYLFFFVILFKTKFLTDDQTELLMECMNVVLLFTNMKYRFPVKATTLLSSSELLKRCYEGVTQYSVCKCCHRLYRLNENGRSTVTVCRKCDESLIIGGTSNSHLPKMLFEYNCIVSTLKKFMCRQGFVDSLLKWKSRPQQQNLMLDVYDGNVWKQFGSHSSGGIYLTIQNLARDERNLKENVICVGLLPGPKEPSGAEINNYLSPLVDELSVLFDEGVLMDVLVDGALKKERMRAALTMVACDLPAARKLCGFTAGNSNCACHKCLKQFGSLDGDMMRRDFRNFDMASWIPRTNYTHRQAAMEWYQQLNETSKSRHANLHGTKYSELLRLRYFDPVVFTVVDPMHNLYLGTAKKMMMIWRTTIKNRRLMLTNDDMKKVAEARNIQLPVGYDSSSLIRKMTTGEIGFSHLKADERKVWVTSISKVLLLGKLDRQYYQHWLKFVDANILIASPSITTEDVEEAHRLLISFCSEMEGLYGAKNIYQHAFTRALKRRHNELWSCLWLLGV
ncbi:hypothetical protein RO3G_03622 [Rhizopus delemar RA 99-880]|uniref:Transposase domain-containing protein n=1 Tax=Rhizopus delemar (strain RA 99-880 / ATCC MYA-4621 / FGSC 9543 / NRRL 43880) TaxID=246409 RepID=I1BRT7_RHIO9|nr:hypothetical protein RO3G_03622 [Rhizopus delemar RA 99-880]|eukprot:EIE78917.1 hypothetical protein RO3G_03622 [Rhizopus delemar RA 99-880]